MNGISVLVRVMRKLTSPLCSLSCEDTREIGSLQPGRGSLSESDNAGTVILDFQLPGL